MELRRLLGVAALVLKHLGGDDADAVDLLAELGIVDLTVDGPDLLKHRSLGILLCGRFFGGLRLRGGRIGQPLAGEHQAVVSVVQIPQGEQAVVQHIGQLIPHLGGEVPRAEERALMEITVRGPASPGISGSAAPCSASAGHPQAAQTAEKKHRTGRVASRYQATSGSIHRLPARAETEVKPKIRLRIPPITVRRLAWTDSRVRTWLETGAEGVRSRAAPFWTVRAPTEPFCWA